MRNSDKPASHTESSDQSLCAVYRQCWPHPMASTRSTPSSLRGLPRHEIRCPGGNPLKSRSLYVTGVGSVHHHINKYGVQQYHHHDLPLSLKVKSDKGGHYWETWRKFREDVNSDLDGTEVLKMTQDTFRQLTKQVREVKMQMGHRSTGCGLKSYHTSSPSSKSALIHPSQLAANLANHPRSSVVCEGGHGEGFRCTRRVEREHGGHQPHFADRRRRHVRPPPRSKSSLSLSRCQPDTQDSSSSYERLKKHAKRVPPTGENLGPFEIIARGYRRKVEETSDSDEIKEAISPGNDFSISEDDIRGTSPELCDLEGELQCTWEGRAREELVLEEDGTDSQSSDASSEPDPIANVLSEPFCYMDLLELSREADWRGIIRRVPSEKTEELIMDRLIEMERLQQATSKLESATPKRHQSILEEKKGWNRDAAKPTEKAHNRLDRKPRSKNCSEDCLSPACAGGCRPASSVDGRPACAGACSSNSSEDCTHCREKDCEGQCLGHYNYHLHVRRPRQEIGKKARPKSCQSCVRKPKRALDAVNGSNVILGRPKSAFSTFSSVQRRRVSKMNMKVNPSNVEKSTAERMRGLNITTSQNRGLWSPNSEVVARIPRKRVRSAKPAIGRDTLLSDKSFQSQRKNSITTRVCPPRAAWVKNAPAPRSRPRKHRRAKSANR